MSSDTYKPLNDSELSFLKKHVYHPRYSDSLLMEQAKRANACADWMKANIPEMECRQDEDCDHCHGAVLLAAYLGESEDMP